MLPTITIATEGLSFRIRETAKGDEIFDPFRRRWVLLTPEEWVRQSLLGYLVQVCGYPARLVAVERALRVGERLRRFDALVFDNTASPWMLIECKAPAEPIGDKAVGQLLAYQSELGAGFLVLSNGRQLRCWQVNAPHVVELQALPEFPKPG